MNELTVEEYVAQAKAELEQIQRSFHIQRAKYPNAYPERRSLGEWKDIEQDIRFSP